jgi:endonuclease/exonuclease/phosphatase family metal-dependent hydrolase
MKSPSVFGATSWLTRLALLLAVSLLTSCDKKISVTPGDTSAPASAAASQPSQPTQAVHTAIAATAVASDPAPPTAQAALRFVSYNVENWLILEDRFDFETRQSSKNAPKPEKEKAAVIEILKQARPDVLGLCEIGTIEDLKEIQQLLQKAGIDLPHLHHSGGVDSTRFLGLLSRYPISKVTRHEKLNYRLNGREYSMQRGILDATVTHADGRSWRFMGLHLKSKREVQDGNQNQMRINEAQLLRKQIDQVLREDPKTRLIVYGDLNDTRMSPAIRIVQGPYNSPRTMTAIPLKDSRGLSWTHFWAKEDVYSRIDYILYSAALKDELVLDECHILDPSNWNDASDHRAILGVFR